MNQPPTTRFAPSPTGLLHVGGARTALFCWLFARNQGGRFLLRIEDTDRARSTPAATQTILDGLRWLGLDWDGPAVSQSARVERHREVAERLLASGAAYRGHATAEEVAAAREEARKARQPFRGRSPWRDRAGNLPDAPFAIRLRCPRDGATRIEDAVQGAVTWQNRELDDLVLLRSDGTPTYMLAVVADDHDMGVTHVIRGADHLTNAARQSQIFDALGWDRPAFAHVPLIHGPDGGKYSKRHGAVGLDEFAAQGILPAAMRNALARLGWSHGDREFFPTDELLRLFSLDALNKAAARFDPAKLLSLNAEHLRALPTGQLAQELDGFLGAGRELSGVARSRLLQLLPELKPRVRSLAELADMAGFLFRNGPPEMDKKAQALLNAGNRRMLEELTGRLTVVSLWEQEGLAAALREFSQARSMSLGKVAQPLRAALTGRTGSPGIFDVMAVLGRAETLARLRAIDESPHIG